MKSFKLTPGYDEFRIWVQYIKPELNINHENTFEIIEYITTEILNNAQDHADANEIMVTVEQNNNHVAIMIADNGVGLFHRIMTYLNLEQPLDAAIELSKGKCTTMPDMHSGEGLFFSTQAADVFEIIANGFCFRILADLIEFKSQDSPIGTQIKFVVNHDKPISLTQIFDQYCIPDEDNVPVFSHTKFRIQLSQVEGNLVARSQAKRLMSRMENFKSIELDFSGVEKIGQAYADEIFRVWQNKYPDIVIKPFNKTDAVDHMISRSVKP